MNPTEPNVPAIRQRWPMTEARLKANRENAKKAALSGRSGRPRGSMDGNRLSLRERCRVRDEEHVATLENNFGSVFEITGLICWPRSACCSRQPEKGRLARAGLSRFSAILA